MKKKTRDRQNLQYTIDGEDVHIKLPCGNICIIDKVNLWVLDIFTLAKTKGHVSVFRSVKVKYGMAIQRLYLHRLIFKGQVPPGGSIDHINRNGLDNRLANLRIATRKQNAANAGPSVNSSTKYKGITWRKKASVNQFHIYFAKPNNVFLGSFSTAEEAAYVRDLNELQRSGDFAYLNFPEKKEEYLEKIKALGLNDTNIYKKTREGYGVYPIENNKAEIDRLVTELGY